jgi:hypothetical protein
LKVKKYLRIGKPAVKGSILVIFGILNSRLGIGVEIFKNNLIYGPLAYLFLSLSGIMIARLLLISGKTSENNRKQVKRYLVISGIFYLIGFILIVLNLFFNTFIYYFNIPILIFTLIMGIFWFFIILFGPKLTSKIKFLNYIIVSLIFSMGILYGAFLNSIVFPFFIYYFFFSVAFLQLSREIMKDLNLNKNKKELLVKRKQDLLLKISLLFDILAIWFFFLPVYSISSYPLVYLVFMICGIIFIIFAGLFTLESILEKKISYRISLILKIGILFQLMAFLISGG